MLAKNETTETAIPEGERIDAMNTPQALLDRYSSDTPLAQIPWQELPTSVQEVCWSFIQGWWNRLDIDQTIEASGLFNMTLAEVLALEKSKADKRYRVVAFIRIDSEEEEVVTYQEAIAELEQQNFMFPENTYQIEEVNTDENY
ncbi:MAG: hypothetical protein JW384_03141 [Nitrosomonadaceae bacterium]|nr:hypothetical protein [Nitrosomonadaceae bacterium]